MTRGAAKSLVRRVEALESKLRKTAPPEHNPLLEMAITAMIWAWTPEEVEQMLAAAERSQLDELPIRLGRRWARGLDSLSRQRFGTPFGTLLAWVRSNPEAVASPGVSLES
jgi:hypothetical protein